ncbi:precorrin-3B synthase [Streptomyces sp. NPDC052496]|uniref:precorrin-3B synthase n=1 Tax=Streptomyces sp. NPDC052496 TaxID=3154951 RepID=UPI0034423DB0
MLAAMPPTPAIPPHRDESLVRDRGDACVRDRGDACPGALRLHSAADGHLARLRLPAGLLTARQALALADAADRLGDGHLSLTSRGNAELRGLGDDCAEPLADLLRAAGLLPSDRHERVRNIVASPLAGLDGQGADGGAAVQEWARELDRLLCASDAAPALSGRFLFALDDGRGDVASLGADVTLIAESGGTALLRVGDDDRALRVPGGDAPRSALAAAEAFLTVAREAGTGSWRVRELPPGYAAPAVRALLRTRLPEPYTQPYAQVPAPAPPRPGLITSPRGTTSLSVLAPLGRLTTAQLRRLAAVAAPSGGTSRTESRGGSAELRMTPWRGVVLPGLPPETAGPGLRELATAGLVTDPASPWYGLGACTGRPGCAKSLSDVRADAAATLPGNGAGLPVHWSGCARRCGHPHGAWVDVVATGDAYEVSVRGTRHGAPATTTVPLTDPADRLADAVASARAATRTTP